MGEQIIWHCLYNRGRFYLAGTFFSFYFQLVLSIIFGQKCTIIMTSIFHGLVHSAY